MRPSLSALPAMFVLLATMPARADCGGEILAAFAAMQQAMPYRSEMLSKSTFGTVKTTSDVDLPRGLRTRVEGPEPSHTLIVGERAWRDQGQGLEELPSEQARTVAAHVRATMARQPAAPQKPVCGATETREGRSFRVYEYEQPFKLGDDPGVSTARVLVDAATGLPAHMEVNSTALGMMSLTLVTITFDKSIRVEPPPPP